MTLILMRHAKAEPHAVAAGDFDRRLVDEGRERAQANARLLAGLGVTVDLALVSPAARAAETWRAAEPVLGGRCVEDRALYLASPATILERIRAAAPAEGTMCAVGHNPGMGELARGLAAAGGAPEAALRVLDAGFPTASAALFDWPGGQDAPRFRALAVKGRLIGA